MSACLRNFVASFVASFVDQTPDKARAKDGGTFLMACSIWRLNAGNPLTSWNSLSHNAYWTDGDVTDRLADLWKAANP
jgi:hypothetical protein